jgi:hypothetical protein
VEYALPVLIFLLVCAGGVAVLVIVARLTADDEAPLGDTDEHSDAVDERRAA